MRKTLRPGESDPEAEVFYLRLMVATARLGGTLGSETLTQARWALDNEHAPFGRKVKALAAAMRSHGFSEWHIAFAGGLAMGYAEATAEGSQGADRQDFLALRYALREAAKWKGRNIDAAR